MNEGIRCDIAGRPTHARGKPNKDAARDAHLRWLERWAKPGKSAATGAAASTPAATGATTAAATGSTSQAATGATTGVAITLPPAPPPDPRLSGAWDRRNAGRGAGNGALKKCIKQFSRGAMTMVHVW